jgi:tripeptide aminopeptidase
MVNAIKIAGEVLDALPKSEWSPETTEGREGFVHPVSVNGIAEKSTIQFIVREFTREGLASHHERLKTIAEAVVSKHAGATIEYEIKEQYRNMKEVLDTCPHVVEYAREAIERAGLNLKVESIRGGTDGSRLSFMGLPCPNIFTGMQNIHSKLEWIGVEDMMKATETILHLGCIWAEKGKFNEQ